MSFKRLDESLCPSNLAIRGPMSTSQLTPPRSPTHNLDDSFSFDPFPLVNPNSILDETNHFTDTDTLNINLELPFPDAMEIKLEDCDGWWSNICQHGFADSFCSTCSKDEKSEVLNDCMWAPNALQIEPSTMLPSQEPQPRSHFDSSHTELLVDPLFDMISGEYDADELSPSHRLETPSESSDTDVDFEEEHPIVETVHLDHNYHSINHRRRNDIRSPLRKALSRVSKTQTDSDDEIDVVNVSDPHVFSRVPNYHGVLSVTDSEESSFSSTSTPVKRGRKPAINACTSKKVGRPCKSKRLNAKSPKPVSRRCGSRALQMDPLKRSLHNSMERMRRVDLKKCFDLLRCLIPSLKERSRAPKVLILQSAFDCVRNLQKTERKMLMELEKRKQYQRKLLVKLQRLKEEAAIAGKEFG